jgi:predicted ATPase/DNA-binding CsgD family transcriptional regulator
MIRLPAPGAEFVGRRRELAEGGRLLAGSRLLTLTGAAGIGKTRLAIELARRATAAEVWFVELSSLRGARAPGRALAIAAGLSERRDPDELAEGLSGRAGLVVLDNCEHLVAACAELAGVLVTGCPEIRVLATSRERLGVPGEVVWQVPGLELPDVDGPPSLRRLRSCDAVMFFSRSASRRLPGFTISDLQVPTAARICRRLDANPLAVELAAARIAHLTLEEIELRLAGSLHILTSEGRGGPERHRSLWAAVDWSHGLLTESDRAMFRRLSVFRGGFGLDAAAAVAGPEGAAGDVLAEVTRLVDRSLVLSLATAGTPRYRLLETLREHGLSRLRDSGGESEVRARHAAWFLGVAERASQQLRGPRAVAVLEGFELEHDNFRAALDWGLEHDAALAARLGTALSEFWVQRGYLSEGRERLDRCLEAAADSGGPPFALLRAAVNLAIRQSDFSGCRAYLERLTAGSRDAGNRSAEAHAHDLSGRIALEEGDVDRADEELTVAMRLFRELDDAGGQARVHWHLNMIAMRRGDVEASRRHIERIREIVERFDDPWSRGHVHLALARVGLACGDPQEAARELCLALPMLGAVADRWSLANAVRFAAALVVERGSPEASLVLLGAADAMDEVIGARPGPAIRAFAARCRDRATKVTPAAAAAAAEARGRRLTLSEAVAHALDLVRAADGRASRAAAVGLTRREAEVARLIAGGATDREIGGRLGISTRTVEKHAENVRSKLGVESRTAVAEALRT